MKNNSHTNDKIAEAVNDAGGDFRLTRRTALSYAAIAGASFMFADCSGRKEARSAAVSKMLDNAAIGERVAVKAMAREKNGADPGAAAVESAAREVIEELGGFPWLRRGDRVLLKMASNSAKKYPAVVRPELVTAVARLLKKEGAGAIFIADHPGVETVHHTKTRRKGSSRDVFAANGLAAAAQRGGCVAAGFEEKGYGGFIVSGARGLSGWCGPLMLPGIVNEVDHILYLNRVSAHAIGGATLALKNAVGWLREDSRLELHRDAASFSEKCAEINAAPEIAQRVRLFITDASRVQSTIGPDFGYSAAVDPPLLIASKNIALHDVACHGLLAYARAELTPWYAMLTDPYPRMSNLINKIFVQMIWGWSEGDAYRALPAPARGRAVENGIIRRGVEIFSPKAARPDLFWIGGVPASIRNYLETA